MYRKNYFSFLLILTLFLLGSVAVSAQTKALTGEVQMTKEDGTKEPFSGALVEVYRTDKKGAYPSTQTDAKGEFSITGIEPDSTFVVSVSGKGIGPAVTTNLTAGKDNNLLITVSKGDSRHLTEEEVKQVLANPGGGPTAEQKAEIEKINKKNEITQEQNNIIKKNLEEGNKAFNDKDYDAAIAKYDEAYKVDTEFIGTAPVLLNNKAISLKARAIENYNKKTKDKSLAAELSPKIKQDISDSITAFNNSWKLLAKPAGADGTDIKAYEGNKQITLEQAQSTIDVMLQMNLSPDTKKEEIKTLTDAYVNVEKDKAKKANAYVNLGQYYSDVYDYDASISTLKNAVEIDPSNAEALGRLTLALYTQGTLKNDGGDAAAAKTLKQETLTYGQKYLKVAAKDDPLRDGITAVVADVKGSK